MSATNGTARKTPVANTPTSASRAQSPTGTASAPTSATTAAAPKKTAPSNNKSSKPDDDPNSPTQRCKHCKEQVPKEGFSIHSKNCLRKKKEEKKKQQEALAKANGTMSTNGDKDTTSALPDDSNTANGSRGGTAPPQSDSKETKKKDNNTTSTKKSASGNNANNKKRKADLLDDAASVASSAAGNTNTNTTTTKAPTKKKQKKDTNNNTPSGSAATTEKKTGGGKPKGPVDVERQCGVLLPNGSMCARSLTCKSHSMGAKRGVPGRSLPYDMLLANYQKKNQARQQKERMAAHGAALEEMMGETGEQGPVDSDEERDRVVAAIARSHPRPLTAEADPPPATSNAPFAPHATTSASLTGYGCAQFVPGSVAKRHQYVRLREMLGNALGGSRGGGLFSTAPAAAAAIKERAYTGTDDAAPLSAGLAPASAGLPGGAAMGGQSRRQSSVGGGEHVRRGSGSALEGAMAV